MLRTDGTRAGQSSEVAERWDGTRQMCSGSVSGVSGFSIGQKRRLPAPSLLPTLPSPALLSHPYCADRC